MSSVESVKQRKIIHVDMDCFFAAVEMRDNPSLKSVPLAIGGRPDQRGVLSTCNYPAREFGLHSAMPTAYALKLCPQLILMRGNMEKYKHESAVIKEIFSDYTDLIEPLSLDEAYLDVTDCSAHAGSATLIAEEILKRIFDTTGLTASAGVASNKFLAKICSDLNKPDGLYVLPPDKVEEFMIALSVKKIWGVGKVGANRLKEEGFETCGELQKYSMEELHHKLGNWGARLYNLCRGIDNSPVQISRERKSISQERTFNHDVNASIEELQKYAEGIYSYLQRAIQNYQSRKNIRVKARKLFIKLKFSDFSTTTVERQFNDSGIEPFIELIKEGLTRNNLKIRLLGLGIKIDSRQDFLDGLQLDLFEKIEY